MQLKSEILWNLGSNIPEHVVGAIVAAWSIDPTEIGTGEAFKYRGRWYWLESMDRIIAEGHEPHLTVLAWIAHIPFPVEEFRKWQQQNTPPQNR